MNNGLLVPILPESIMKLLFPPKTRIHRLSTTYPNQTHYSGFFHKSYHHNPSHLINLLNTTKSQTKIFNHATQIHTQIITNNFTSHSFLFNTLLNTYSKYGHINQALLLFSTNQNVPKSVVSWTILISQLTHHNKPSQAMQFFNQMRRIGIYPNKFTLSAVLPACAASQAISFGKRIHCLAWKHGLECELFVASALLDMYAKCNDFGSSMKVFDEMPERNLVSWNSMIVGCLQNKLYDMAVGFFKEVIGLDSVTPDQVSFSSVLSACANAGDLEFGKQVHGVIAKHGLMDLHYVRNALMDLYSKCGLFDDARVLFEVEGNKDVIAWNVMITGSLNDGNNEEACNYFWAMIREGILPDEASYSSVLNASASFAMLYQGALIHSLITKSGFMKNNCVSSSLLTMYAKCGSLLDATRTFEEIENRNVVCWTAMIAACQQHGQANRVIELFEDMLAEKITPDYITFVCVISACGHTGRVEEGYKYFNSMTEIHGMKPGHEHNSCMVDMLGRAGRVLEAKKFIESMPIEPGMSVWGALLWACTNCGNIELGKEVAEKLFELEPENPGNYVLLSNLYARNGMLKEADEVRRLMGVKRVKKEPGCSWVDIQGSTFVFKVHDRSHPRSDEIYLMLKKMEDLVKKRGYIAETQYAVNSEEGFKEHSLWHHSEKIALAFALLVLPPGVPIRIMKNLRTCGDCHTVMKFASEIFEREIIVRDINRFHHFTSGSCSCGDYW